jgi:hypothetical protein
MGGVRNDDGRHMAQTVSHGTAARRLGGRGEWKQLWRQVITAAPLPGVSQDFPLISRGPASWLAMQAARIR